MLKRRLMKWIQPCTTPPCFDRKNKSKINEIDAFEVELRSVNEIKVDITRNEHEKWRNIINSNNPSNLWKDLSWKGGNQDVYSCTPSDKEFGEYFVKKSTIEGE